MRVTGTLGNWLSGCDTINFLTACTFTYFGTAKEYVNALEKSTSRDWLWGKARTLGAKST
jgi:hypothetical protein